MLSNTVRLRGLYTFGNELSQPEGSAKVVDNINIDEPSVMTPRRGFKDIGAALNTSTDRVRQMMVYKDSVFRHYNDVIEFLRDGTYYAFDGSYSSLDPDIRIKYQEANGNLYFTTSTGVKKISALNNSEFSTEADYITDAGVPQALEITGNVVYSTTGFLPPESKVAYKVLFGKRDRNNNLLLGTPSSRYVIANISTEEDGLSANVQVSFTVPSGVDNTYFYQLYRTSFISATDGLTINDIDPGEEHNLVHEEAVTVAAGSKITVTDITPETFRNAGLPLYNNPISGQGILQSNDIPPIAKDIENYKGVTFYSNTSTFHQQTLTIVSVDDISTDDSKFIITNEDVVREYTFQGAPTVYTIDCGTKENTIIHDGMNNAKMYMFSASNTNKYVFYFDDGTAVAPTDTDAVIVKVDISALAGSDNVNEAFAIAINQFADFNVTTGVSDVVVTTNENGEADATDTPTSAPATDLGTGWGIALTQAGEGEDAANGIILLSGSDSVALRIERTARSLVNVINTDILSPVNAYYLSGQIDLPGKILFKARSLENKTFYAVVKDIDSTDFNPEIPSISDDSFSAITIDGTKTRLTLVDHDFTDDEEVFINCPNNTPAILGVFNVTVVDNDNIEIDFATSSADATNSYYFFPYEKSDNLSFPNRIYYSKINQPEAVPIVNYIDIGTKDEPIERILSLRDYLFALKTDGIFMISGDNGLYSVRQLDTEKITCPDSAVVLNNQIFMLSRSGVISINENTPSIISRMIENKFQSISKSGNNIRSTGFGISYEDDRAYLLWLPSDNEDVVNTQCFRYNILERNWTRWTKTATAGVILDTDSSLLYIADGDRAMTMVERKNLDRTDHADRDFVISMAAGGFENGKYSVTDTTDLEVGDVITQTQYLNFYEYNRFLQKLDIDTGIPYASFFTDYEVKVASSLANLMNAVNAKLYEIDTSNTITEKSFNNADWVDMQTKYNLLVAELNESESMSIFKDYDISENSLEFEYVIDSITSYTNEITINGDSEFVQGDFTVYKHIKSTSTFNPIHFGDPSGFKQVNKGYLLFDQNNFLRMTLEYSTDLSPSFTGHEFRGKGKGFWGDSTWGFEDRNYWGGDGSDSPRRVIIPRNKQRCRYITVRFTHNIARDFYKVVGVAHDVRLFSERAYK